MSAGAGALLHAMLAPPEGATTHTFAPTPQRAPCCICPPECDDDEMGDVCMDASCAWCLHGCPAIDLPCCGGVPAPKPYTLTDSADPSSPVLDLGDHQ